MFESITREDHIITLFTRDENFEAKARMDLRGIKVFEVIVRKNGDVIATMRGSETSRYAQVWLDRTVDNVGELVAYIPAHATISYTTRPIPLHSSLYN